MFRRFRYAFVKGEKHGSHIKKLPGGAVLAPYSDRQIPTAVIRIALLPLENRQPAVGARENP